MQCGVGVGLGCRVPTARAAAAGLTRTTIRGAPVRLPAAGSNGRKGHRRATVMKIVNDQVGSAYATALVELAESQNALETVHSDVDALLSLLNEDASLKEFLLSPIAGDDNKKSVLKTLGKECGFHESTISFLQLAVDKGRIDCIEEILDSFEVEYCKLTDTQVAILRSAVKLEQEQQFLIAKKLQELTGSKNIKLKPIIDETLIAGFIVEYGSSQIDMSVKGQLNRITADLQMAVGID